jgi:hypothetical protein
MRWKQEYSEKKADIKHLILREVLPKKSSDWMLDYRLFPWVGTGNKIKFCIVVNQSREFALALETTKSRFK